VQHPEATVARIDADIDAANAASVQEELAASLPHDVGTLVVDLSRCAYLDSAGIDMLFRLDERMRQRRRRLRVVIPAESPLIRLAEIVALGQDIALHASVEDAIGASGP
jgi:anti-anti-sigma factor